MYRSIFIIDCAEKEMIHVKNDSSIVTSLTSQSLAANQPEVNKGKLTTIMSTQS